ncbi:MAG: hypothetical protein ACI8RZ_007637, partial [Myxococcota bacterium]
MENTAAARKGILGILMGALLLTTACDTARYTEGFNPEGNITRIVVKVDAGNIELIEGDTLRVERTIRGAEGALELSHRIEYTGEAAETLTLIAQCAALLPCSVDTRITVPAGTPVDVELARGAVWATGIDGLSLELDRGDADLDIRGPLVARIGNGSLIATLPADASARIAVGHGDIALQIPAGAWRVDATAAHLVVDEQIRLSPDA